MAFEFLSPDIIVDPKNFNTCRNRSEEPVEFVTKLCCGKPDQKITGFRCNLFNIDGISVTTCVNCKSYHGKDRQD